MTSIRLSLATLNLAFSLLYFIMSLSDRSKVSGSVSLNTEILTFISVKYNTNDKNVNQSKNTAAKDMSKARYEKGFVTFQFPVKQVHKMCESDSIRNLLERDSV